MSLKPKTIAARTLAALKARYPQAFSQLQYNSPWELLVATILAAQCTDARVNQVTPRLFQLWPGPAELAQADREKLETIIRPTGFYHNKAKNLIGAARMTMDEFGGTLPKTIAELTRLPGVARKTANVVLFGGFGINEGLAVDTHVKRISYRLGLTEQTDPVAVEKDLMLLFPQKEWGDVNHRLVWFGRDVCKARTPMCEKCEMRPFCAQRPINTRGEASHEPESPAPE